MELQQDTRKYSIFFGGSPYKMYYHLGKYLLTTCLRAKLQTALLHPAPKGRTRYAQGLRCKRFIVLAFL